MSSSSLKSLRSTCPIEATLERPWLDLIDGDKQPEASAPHLVPLLSELHSLLFPKGREVGRVASEHTAILQEFLVVQLRRTLNM